MSSLSQKMVKGFTLIEVLLVVVILGILAAIVTLAINPAARLADTNQTQRKADVNQIWSMVNQYGLDKRGEIAKVGSSTGPVDLPSTGAGNFAWIRHNASGTDLFTGTTWCSYLVTDGTGNATGVYASKIPFDPKSGYKWKDCSDYNSGYKIINKGGKIFIEAPESVSETNASDKKLIVVP